MSGSVPSGAGGGSRTHFSHPFLGCLLRVATRCFCSPSPEPIGLRWTCQPRPFSPGDFDRACRNRISLLKIKGAGPDYQSISFHTSLATCLAISSVWTFPINSLPVLKTDTLCSCLVYTKTDSELATTDSLGILVLRDWRSSTMPCSGNTLATLSPHSMIALSS